ncbi:MAG TPA: hypothetical protein DD384_05550 [Firmicutes bacterium]|nr:hypothetical protein [Bacillota bacterium]
MRQFIYQESEKGCGLACLKMALVEATGESNYKFMRLEKHPPYSLKELQETAAKEGMELNFYKANEKEKLKEIDSYPLFLLLNKEGHEHLVYVPRARKEKILVYDPAFGTYWAKKEEIMSNWGLIWGSIKMGQKKICPFKKPKVFPCLDFLLPALSTIVSFLCLYASFFFMQDNGNYLLSIGLLACYGFCEILTRLLLTNAMKKFDRKWLDEIALVPQNLKERYLHYYALKKAIYPDFLSLITSFVLVISLTFLFGANNSYFYLSVAGTLSYIAISSILLKSKTVHRKLILEQRERGLFSNSQTINEAKNAIRSINEESYKIASLIGNERIVYFVILAVFALLPLLSANSVSLNYYLLHFGALFAVGSSLQNIFAYIENSPIREKEQMYFDEYFSKDD